jgi:6-pyruvoyltetrahydropterin/6-carboxytetrahydropterin synthase
MWEISSETEIAAAHQLRFAPGDGEKLHGHNWRIKATVRANELAKEGWVADFYVLGRVLRAIVEPWEHEFLNQIPPYDDLNPTAENIARVVADELAAKMDDDRVRVVRVDVWESATCCATYFRPG